MNLPSIRFEFLEENGRDVSIIADDAGLHCYRILAKEPDNGVDVAIYAYGTEESGYQFNCLSEVNDFERVAFEGLLQSVNLQATFDPERGVDILTPRVTG